MRRILYITGTRADFGLMSGTLRAIHADPDLELSIAVTGTHLCKDHGMTVREVEASGFNIASRVPVAMTPATGATMALAIAGEIVGFCELMSVQRPDILLLLGDRGEMLAGAIAALHLNIPIAHIHGGERSGSVDEYVRHAISKLSHIHFVATAQSGQRLERMGEEPARIHFTGAPGLDGIEGAASYSQSDLWADFSLDSDRPVALLIFHPVVQEADTAGYQINEVVAALKEFKSLQVIAVMPNADAGGNAIARALKQDNFPNLRCYQHLTRSQFLSFLRLGDVLIGNSSAGIIESASFGIPTINIGSRQNLRERNSNVIDVEADRMAITAALYCALSSGRLKPLNIYGDGNAAGRIKDILKTTPLNEEVLKKVMTY